MEVEKQPTDDTTTEVPAAELEKQTNPADGELKPEQKDAEKPDIPEDQKPLAHLPDDHHNRKHADNTQLLFALAALLILAVITLSAFMIFRASQNKDADGTSDKRNGSAQSETEQSNQVATGSLTLDAKKIYGDKYASGVLPVGDSQYTTDKSKASNNKVYVCEAKYTAESVAGAQTRGPWFVSATQWDVNKKAHVGGNVKWEQKTSNTINGDNRVITTNDLPDHMTGSYPIAAGDPAAKYDRNPNAIKSQNLTYNLTASPSYGDPHCIDGKVGVMLSGVSLFSAFDAGGRDAGAWEVQDSCQGHPQVSGEYHYHSLSSCIKDSSVSQVIGYAMDGFPITGPKVGDKNYLTSSDLDQCHGLTSEVTIDGQKKTTYHYVMTQDFPYSASCFRGTPAASPGSHNDAQLVSAR